MSWTTEDLLTLSFMPGLGLVGQQQVLQHCESFNKLEHVSHAAIKRYLSQADLRQQIQSKIDALMQQQAQGQFAMLSLFDEHYPQQLAAIADPPLVLFLIGNTQLLYQPQVAMVGSRHASHYALNQSEQIAQSLVNHGMVVTSGLAQGVDASAHKGALVQNNATIAVLGTGIDKVYPKANAGLRQQILQQGGLLVSEYAPGTGAEAWRFPARNRIISGLSQAVLVMEAGAKSGSLITARLALEQGRDVYALPGLITNPNTQGVHQLISQGANIITSIEQLHNDLNIEAPKQTKAKQDHFLLKFIDYEPTPFDVILSRSRLSHSELAETLLQLELSACVIRGPGGYAKV